jgi:hypothetical protein
LVWTLLHQTVLHIHMPKEIKMITSLNMLKEIKTSLHMPTGQAPLTKC